MLNPSSPRQVDADNLRSAVGHLKRDIKLQLSEIFSSSECGEGPYLVATAVTREVYQEFAEHSLGIWSRFRWDSSGEVWYHGDSTLAHQMIITSVTDYLQDKLETALNDMPIGPASFEAKVKRKQKECACRRGSAIFRVLLQKVGSMTATTQNEVQSGRTRPLADDERIGFKEADELIVAAGDAKKALFALEVAYKNESLEETAKETFAWSRQRTIAIGIKVDTTSKLHELDPQVALFICREKQRLEAGEDRMVLDQYAIGYGSGIKFSTRRCREDMFSHAKEQHTEATRRLLDDIDWKGEGKTLLSSWSKAVDGFKAHEGKRTVKFPIGDSILYALLAFNHRCLPMTMTLIERCRAAEGMISETMLAFLRKLSIKLDLRHLRELVLNAVLEQYRRLDNRGEKGTTYAESLQRLFRAVTKRPRGEAETVSAAKRKRNDAIPANTDLSGSMHAQTSETTPSRFEEYQVVEEPAASQPLTAEVVKVKRKKKKAVPAS